MKERQKQKKRFGMGALIGTAAATLVVTLIGVGCAAWLVLGRDGLSLLQGITLVKTQFVGEKTEQVTDQALSGMIEGLGDRWSYYLDAEAYQAEQERRANVYVGIGVTVDYTSEAGLTIRAVVPGGSAEEAGLAEGELITAVDGEDIAGEARYEAPDRIAGEEGSTVRLTVRGLDGNSREVELVRKSIQTDPVSYEYLANGVGYVKLSNFFAGSADRVKEAVTDLQSQGATSLVFDMRDNGGGYLDELIPMLDFLLPEGPIFQTRSHTGAEKIYESDAACVDLPMAVLVNENTYSAAEIFAAELQEEGAAVVIGAPTSGKGYSQQLFPLLNGGALGISTAEYFTGNGVSLIGAGLHLDRETALSEEDQARLTAGVLPLAEDIQFQAALELLGMGA